MPSPWMTAPTVRSLSVRTTAALTALALCAAALSGCTGDADATPATNDGGAAVLASTTWVGALAKAAGATDIAVIAPATVPDQARFDPTADELAPAGRAEHVLYAETDGFAAALTSAAGDAHLVPVKPSNTLPAIRAEVTRLGQVLGTQAAAARWLTAFEAEANALSESLKGLAPIPPLTAVAQAEVAHWAPFAGVRVVASYGPTAVSPARLTALAAMKPKLLLANAHVPTGTPVIPGSIRVDLVNYPGTDLDLRTVFRTNADRIGATFAK